MARSKPVDLLDKRVIADPALLRDGKKVASKPLHNLATHLLAAQLNFGAGACTTPTVLSKAQAAEKLLDKYDFKGTLTYRMPLTTTDAATANSLAKYLDNYNNGMSCGSTMP